MTALARISVIRSFYHAVIMEKRTCEWCRNSRAVTRREVSRRRSIWVCRGCAKKLDDQATKAVVPGFVAVR